MDKLRGEKKLEERLSGGGVGAGGVGERDDKVESFGKKGRGRDRVRWRAGKGRRIEELPVIY